MATDPEKDDDPLELVPEEEADAPARPRPPAPEEVELPAPPAGGVSEEPVRTARTKRIEERLVESESRPPPEFSLAALREILLWPLRGEAAANLGVAFGIYLVALVAVAVVAALAGFIGGAMSGFGAWIAGFFGIGIYLAGLAFLLEFAGHLVVATLRGDLAVGRVFGSGGGVPREGFVLLAWVLIYFAPAIVAGIAAGSLVVFGLLGMAGWLLVPAAVLLTSASGRFLAGNPVTAGRLAAASGRGWLLVVAPLVPFAVLRMLPVGGLVAFVVEALAGAVLVYTFLLGAILVRARPAARAVVTEWAAAE